MSPPSHNLSIFIICMLKGAYYDRLVGYLSDWSVGFVEFIHSILLLFGNLIQNRSPVCENQLFWVIKFLNQSDIYYNYSTHVWVETQNNSDVMKGAAQIF